MNPNMNVVNALLRVVNSDPTGFSAGQTIKYIVMGKVIRWQKVAKKNKRGSRTPFNFRRVVKPHICWFSSSGCIFNVTAP